MPHDCTDRGEGGDSCAASRHVFPPAPSLSPESMPNCPAYHPRNLPTVSSQAKARRDLGRCSGKGIGDGGSRRGRARDAAVQKIPMWTVAPVTETLVRVFKTTKAAEKDAAEPQTGVHPKGPYQ
jgi:hypothetical protein